MFCDKPRATGGDPPVVSSWMWKGDGMGTARKVMRRKLLPLGIAAVLACVTAATGLAAGSTKVQHFTDTHLANVCGFSGTLAVRGTAVLRDTGNGTYFRSGSGSAVFTADNGKSATVSFAGPEKQTSAPVIDEQAGTVTIRTTYGGLFVRLSITRGPTLSRDAGPVTFVDVYEYTGDPIDPIGAFVSGTLSGLHGPHPDLLSDFSLRCDILIPYLQAP